MRQLPIWCMLKCARLYGSYSANTSSDLPLSAYVLLHSCMHDRLCSRLQGAAQLCTDRMLRQCTNDKFASAAVPRQLACLVQLGYKPCTGSDSG